MDVIDALAQLAAAERALMDALIATFPTGSTLTLDIGTAATPHVVRGQVLGPVTEVEIGQQLALAVRMGEPGPVRLWPLPLGREQVDLVQAVGK